MKMAKSTKRAVPTKRQSPAESIEVKASSEQRILEAARKVFTRKGYAATRTRDIAEEAGINLALLNYYFRSKEKLFHEVMIEKVQQIFGVLKPIINDERTSLFTKIELIANTYIDLIKENPDLPFFVLNEMRSQNNEFQARLPSQNLVRESHYYKQVLEARPDADPYHFILNVFSIIIFPFVAKPVQESLLGLDESTFLTKMEERRKWIPLWAKAMLEA